MTTRIPLPGLVIAGRYRIAERLGGGGMGEVYRAEDMLAGSSVALKILRPELCEDENVTRRFFQEAQAADKIRHPNIVKVIDSGFSETGPYIAMELLVGESSAQTLARTGKLPIEAVVAIGSSVLEALEVAHRAGIIHRDLKPENVYLHRGPGPSPSITVKLLDFGIAKVLEPMGPTPRTHTGVVFGTPDYLSPEQANGEYLLDGRSDVFAVGVLLFELLTATRPFRAATAVATAYKVVHAAAPTLLDAGGPDHPVLEAVVARALRKRPEERYATVGDFARELALVAPDPEARSAALERLVGPSFGSTVVESARWSSPFSSPPSTLPGLGWPSEPLSAPSSRGKRPSRVRRTPISSAISSPAALSPPLSPPASAYADPPSRDTSRSLLTSGNVSPPSAPTAPFEPSSDGPRLRGSILRAIDRTVVRRHGILLRAGILDRLPPSYSNDLQHSTIAGAALYGLDAFETYAAALSELVLGTDASYWREIGRSSTERELTNLLRPLFRSADDITLLRRGAGLWSKLLDFGTWAVRPEAGRIVMHIGELAPAPTPLRHWLVGMVEQTLWSAGFGNAAVTIAEGDDAPAADLVLDVISGPRH